MGAMERLSARKVATAKAPGTRLCDGKGLWLQTSVWGTKSWIFQFTSPTTGRIRQYGLGSLDEVSLAEARDQASELRKQVRNGIDPIEARREQRQQRRLTQVRIKTFREAAEQYIAAHAASWRHAKHLAQWKQSLATYAHPILGGLSVASIDTDLVMQVLTPIWNAKPTTAKRVRGRIETILDYAKVLGHRTGENPARWRGHLKEVLPAPSKVKAAQNFAALPYAEVATFMAELRERQGIAARALEFTILTACRTSEVIGATWDEIDLQANVWIIPAYRTKTRTQHRVPLSGRVLTILKSLPREDGTAYMFIGGKKGPPLNNQAMLKVLTDMRRGITVHGFRSTFRDWASETTSFANHVVEMALAHAIRSIVEKSYRRGDLLEKRKPLMQAWATYCERNPVTADNVTVLRSVTA
jgi:integrase